jgi:glutathione S-transferase
MSTERMATLTLVSHTLCPYVQRVAIALAEKGIPFERLYVDLASKPDWFLARSPLGKTPLLQVDDEAIFESAVICEYLEDAYGTPLHPSDPLQRAKHRAWMEFGSAVLGDIWGYETAQDAATTDRKAGDLRSKFQWLERNLAEGPWFAGDRFSLVDAVFGPVFRYFDVFDTLADHQIFTATPKVRAWRSALAERPSVRNAVTADYEEQLMTFLCNKSAYLYRAPMRSDSASATAS